MGKNKNRSGSEPNSDREVEMDHYELPKLTKAFSDRDMLQTSINYDKVLKEGKKISSIDFGASSKILETAADRNIQPVQLHFENVKYTVKIEHSLKDRVKGLFSTDDTKQNYKTILKGISGTVNPGTMLAIMGSSGAGKTTLLNLLAGRVDPNGVEGEIYLNATPRAQSPLAKKAQAYILQDDILLHTQTPREILEFSAKLRLPKHMSRDEKKEQVNRIIDELNIGGCQDTQIGAPGKKRGVSGGERKRVSIGTELVTNPSLIFVDEPTSGLDSFTAENVMTNLRQLALSGRTVIATIHQPNSDIFRLFDQLMLLADGHCMYYGPAAGAVPYFAQIGYPCPEYTNPTDFFLDILHIDYSLPREEIDEKVNKLSQAYNNSQEAQVQALKLPAELPTTPEYLELKHDTLPFYETFWLIFSRNFSHLLREPLKVRAALGQTMFFAILMGLIYLQLDNDQAGVQDRQGALFFLLVNSAMSNVLNVVTTFPAEKAVYFREHSAGMYSSFNWYVAKVLSDLPLQIVAPFLTSVITYWMIGFRVNAGAFFIFYLIIFLVAGVGSGMGYMLGIAASSAEVSLQLVPLTIIPFMIFSGFFVNTQDVPPWFIWIEAISPFRYGFEALIFNEFDSIGDIDCSQSELVTDVGSGMVGCRIPNGDAVINSLDFELGIRDTTLILLGFYTFWRIAGYGALWWKSRHTINA